MISWGSDSPLPWVALWSRKVSQVLPRVLGKHTRYFPFYHFSGKIKKQTTFVFHFLKAYYDGGWKDGSVKSVP